MTRVGLILTATDKSWMGGINYRINLLNAVAGMRGRRIEPVLMVSSRTPDELLTGFPKVEIVRDGRLTEGTRLRRVRQVLERGLGRDPILESLFRQHRIDAVLHTNQLGGRAGLPVIGWIPDFQHRRLPHLFQADDRARRDRGYRKLAANVTTVMVSSADARSDLLAFAPEADGKCRILHFVSTMDTSRIGITRADLLAKYDLPDGYFHLPNQFWAHKNHKVVIEALGRLKAGGKRIVVAATGHTADSRQPEFFPRIQALVKQLDVENEFRILGLVPHEDVRALMFHAAAVINPSHFEGWSTSVEESKSIGRRVLLSDIPVHREQAPQRGAFFPPDDPDALADRMVEALADYSVEREAVFTEAAQAQLSERLNVFATEFQDIVLDAKRRFDMSAAA